MPSVRFKRMCWLLGVVLLSLCLQGCMPKSIKAGSGSGSGNSPGQVQSGGGGEPGSGGSGSGTGAGAGSADIFVPASGDVTVSGSTDWLDDEVECDADGYCSRWVEI